MTTTSERLIAEANAQLKKEKRLNRHQRIREETDIRNGQKRVMDYEHGRNTGAVDWNDKPDDTNNAAGMEAKGRRSTVLAVITALTIFYFLLPILFEK